MGDEKDLERYKIALRPSCGLVFRVYGEPFLKKQLSEIYVSN
jgi:hypothetical protein